MMTILRPGLQATVQDLGRRGWGHLGVPEAGAVDVESLRLANRMVGNVEGAAVVEFLLGGFEVCFDNDAVFCLAGAHAPSQLDCRPIPQHAWIAAKGGQRLSAGRPEFGMWTYLAVRGGVNVPAVLGSRSTDTLSGLGPPPLRAGTSVAVGSVAPSPPRHADVVWASSVVPGGEVTVRFWWGPRDDWFTLEARSALTSSLWEVSHETDRVAARLLGPPLTTQRHDQLPTEGLSCGSIQVPPSGQPIVHLANHPPTGGYPVIAVVHVADLALIGQAVPGTRVRLHQLCKDESEQAS